jgi:hypothetical protein
MSKRARVPVVPQRAKAAMLSISAAMPVDHSSKYGVRAGDGSVMMFTRFIRDYAGAAEILRRGTGCSRMHQWITAANMPRPTEIHHIRS